MISETHIRPVFFTADGREFTDGCEATAYATEKNIVFDTGEQVHVRRVKRTYYSSNDHHIRDSLYTDVVVAYEEEKAKERHEAYNGIKPYYNRYIKSDSGEIYVPKMLVKDTTACGGKTLLVKKYTLSWMYHCKVKAYDCYPTTINPVWFMDSIKEGTFTEITEDEAKELLQRHIHALHKAVEERVKELREKIEAEYKEEKEILDGVLSPSTDCEIPKKYIRYDEDGNEIKEEDTKE